MTLIIFPVSGGFLNTDHSKYSSCTSRLLSAIFHLSGIRPEVWSEIWICQSSTTASKTASNQLWKSDPRNCRRLLCLIKRCFTAVEELAQWFSPALFSLNLVVHPERYELIGPLLPILGGEVLQISWRRVFL